MNAVDERLNLCDELVKTMRSLEFTESQIQCLTNNPHFTGAVEQPDFIQRTMLTMALSNLLMTGRHPTPVQVRVHLNIAANIQGWLSDVRLVVLPFLKLNEKDYFVDL